MSYFVTITFDLENSKSQDYLKIEEELNELGLYEFVIGKNEKSIDLPANTFAGEFEGSSASKVRDDVSNTVKNIFTSNNVKSKIFIAVGGNWSWAIRNT